MVYDDRESHTVTSGESSGQFGWMNNKILGKPDGMFDSKRFLPGEYVNLTWDPSVTKTHEKIQFVYQFYDPQTNYNLAKINYDFIIFQNGKEVFNDKGLSQIGGDYRNFVFSDSGSIIIRIEGIHSSSILVDEDVLCLEILKIKR